MEFLWKFHNRDNLQKNMFCPRKFQKNTKFSETDGLWWEKYQYYKRKYRRQQIIKPPKNTKIQMEEIENNLKISINTERNVRETTAIAAIKQNPK